MLPTMWQRLLGFSNIIGVIDLMRRPTIWLFEKVGAFPELRSRLAKNNALSFKQSASLIAKLKECGPHKVGILYKDGAFEYAKSLENAFVEAGWNAKAELSLRVTGEGVSVYGSNPHKPDEAGCIREALVAAEIVFDYNPEPVRNSIGAFLTIVVGSRLAHRVRANNGILPPK